MLDWYTWNDGAWANIGALTADVPGLSKAETANIAFALALDVPNIASDGATADSLVLSGNQASAWKKQTEAEVEIRWYPDKVTFKTVAAGNYKLAYQQP